MKASVIALSALVGMFGNASAAFIIPIDVSDQEHSYGDLGTGTLQADPNLRSDATATTYIAPNALDAPDSTWLSDGAPYDQYPYVFDITLDQNYDLTSFYLWNYRHSATGDFSVATFTLATSSTETGDNFGTTIALTANAGATGTAAANGTVDTFALSASDVRRVQFTITGVNYGDNSFIGLNEFAFEGSVVPEPGSLALTGGVIALGLLTRRRRH